MVEHAIQFERALELEKSKKPAKRKSEEIDLCEDTLDEANPSKKPRSELERTKQDFSNTIKQLKDSINSRLAPLDQIVETVNSLASCSYNTNSNSNRLDYSRPNNNNTNGNRNNNHNNRFINNNTNNSSRYDNSSRSSDISNSNSRSNFINACLHCAKPNHKFYECNSASENDKTAIQNLLREKKFDFVKLKEKAAQIAQKKKDRSNMAPLNSDSPNQQ